MKLKRLSAAAAILMGLMALPVSHAQAASTSYGETYGSGSYQKVSIVRPNDSARHPLAIFIHGGGWVAGGRAAWEAEATRWAARGWSTVNMDYTRGITGDGVTGDGAQMIKDVDAVVNKYDGASWVDPNQIMFIGDSAGGHLAAMGATRKHTGVKGMVLWSPVPYPNNVVTDWYQNPLATANQQSLAVRANEFFGYSNTTTNPKKYIDEKGRVAAYIIGSQSEWITWSRQGGQLCTYLQTSCSGHTYSGTLHGTDLRDARPEVEAASEAWADNRVGL